MAETDEREPEGAQETRKARAERPSADFVQGTLTAVVGWLPDLPKSVKIAGSTAFLYLVFCLVAQIPPKDGPAAVREIIQGYIGSATSADEAKAQAGRAISATDALKTETRAKLAEHEQRIVGVEQRVESDVAALKRKQAALAAQQDQLRQQVQPARPPTR